MAKFLGEQALIELIAKIKTSLTNYYTSAQVYTKTEVDSLLSSVPKFDVKVVASLPQTNISTTTVYLLISGNETNNLYDEYLYVNQGTEQNPNWVWEKLGTQTVDLSSYATTSAVNSAISSALASYYTKTEIDTSLAAKASLTSVQNIESNVTKIQNTNGGFAAGASSSCSGYGAAIGKFSSSASGGACGYNTTVTSGGAIGLGAQATTGFAGGLNALSTADGAVQLGTGTNNTANTLKFRDKEIIRSDGKLESSYLRFETGIVETSDLPVKSRHIFTALAGKQDSMTEITAAEVDTLFDGNNS